MIPNYSDWTLALYEVLLKNHPEGQAVYLQIDTDSLEQIAQQQVESGNWRNQEQTSWTQAFLRAVRDYLGDRGQLNLARIKDYYLCPPPSQAQRYECRQIARYQLSHQAVICPLSLGFLAAQVLVATQMRSDQEFSSGNYYNRFRQLLQLDCNHLERQGAARLWQTFNYWLQLRQWIPTAHAGQGPQRFIQYPISQCLLRQGDRQKFEQVLNQTCRTHQNMGPQGFEAWLSAHQQLLSRHVRNILSRPEDDLQRQALIQALYAIYLDRSWWDVDENLPHRLRRLQRLRAGLYRYENFWTGEIEYRPYPEMRRLQNVGGSLQLRYHDQTLNLVFDRPGFYQPLPIEIQNPAESQTFALEGSSDLQELVFTGSNTWALVADPLNPHSGVYATWHKPLPGEPFYFLCLETYLQKLVELKTFNLIDWEEKLVLDHLSSGLWYEFRNMQILKTAQNQWQRVQLPPELSYWLLPSQSITLVVKGGLPTRGSGNYLWEFPLQLQIVSSSDEEYACSLKELGQEQTICTFSQRANQPFALKFPKYGCYALEITGPGGRLSKRFNALSWEDLRLRQDITQRYYHPLDEAEHIRMEGGYIYHV